MWKLSVLVCILITTNLLTAKKGFGPGEQDWGYVDVRKGAHMFYWLYYTTANVKNYTERPLVIWLQGGPGASSTGYGNFEELGPLDLNLNPRNHTWVKDMNVLFIDNPVGSGFSYVDSDVYLTRNNYMIAKDLVNLMKTFYKRHPEFKTVPLHIFSESYGGKMAAEFALELQRAINSKSIQSNFKSVALGDSWISPMDSVYSWAPLLLNTGIIDHKGYQAIMEAAQLVEKALKAGDFVRATDLWGQAEVVVLRHSHNVDFYNILTRTRTTSWLTELKSIDSTEIMAKTLVQQTFADKRALNLDDLMRGSVSKALNIPSNVIWGSQSGRTFRALSGDFMKPVIDRVEMLLNTTNINVVVFTGQLDLICATPGTVNWIEKMYWPNKGDYNRLARQPIYVHSILEGYYKETRTFSMYWINRAGHMVPNDNPLGMDYILKRVTHYNK